MQKKNFLGRLKSRVAKNRVAQSIHVFLVMLGLRRDRDLLLRIRPEQKIAPTWSEGNDLSKTSDWDKIDLDLPVFNYNRNRRIKVMFLNSMGGSMSRLSQALMIHENCETSCYINALFPMRHMVHPLETNVNGVFTHKEWREFMTWAVKEHDIVQTTTLPSWPGVAQCYDWLSETMGERHIWRSIGFVHHYLCREDVLPLNVYQTDLNIDRVPDPSHFPGKTFPVRDNAFQLGNNTLFYSSPEKGAYFQGPNKVWLPSIRSPHKFVPAVDELRDNTKPIRLYVPRHSRAVFKGLDEIIETLEQIKANGRNIEIITPENISDYFADINGFKDYFGTETANGAYPVPNRLMPSVLRRVDIVVDQIVMGSYGNTGIEAMLCGKPVVGQKQYAEIADSPIVEANKDNLQAVLENLIDNPQTWADIGRKGREWALKHHAPKAVARIAARQYDRILQSSSSEI